MTHFHASTAEQLFLLHNVFPPTDSITSAWSEFDVDTEREVLTEVARLAEGPLADAFVPGDRLEPHFEPGDFSITLPDEVKAAFATLMDAEYWRLDLPEALGGAAAPPSLRWMVAETILGANPPLFFYMAGPLFAAILHEMGTDEQKRIAHCMAERRWGATMALTEPDAGSDVGAGVTTARQRSDGSWCLQGVKRFITSGDHDLTDNIIHFVLARPVGIEGVGGPGTKGLSLFLVPKFLFDVRTGELGARNGVYVTGMEHKHGMTASTTCELSLGIHGDAAIGYLVGDTHDGIAQMFRIIEYARMMVGTKAISTLSAAYLNARDYAKVRIQGHDIATGPKGPKVAIIEHPDVRRLLLLQKGYTEGLRAVVAYTARWQDAIEADRRGYPDPRGHSREELEAVNDLLLPIVKGVGSERSYEMLTKALAVFGGSGYLRDYPMEQYLRDALIDQTYEGTTAIQGLDFVLRKLLRNRFAAWAIVSSDMMKRLANPPAGCSDAALNTAREQAMMAHETIQQMFGALATWGMEGLQGDGVALQRIALNSTRTLMAVGDWLTSVMLIIMADEAAAMMPRGDTPMKHLADSKRITAVAFADVVLPRVTADMAALEKTGEHADITMSMPAELF